MHVVCLNGYVVRFTEVYDPGIVRFLKVGNVVFFDLKMIMRLRVVDCHNMPNLVSAKPWARHMTTLGGTPTPLNPQIAARLTKP